MKILCLTNNSLIKPFEFTMLGLGTFSPSPPLAVAATNADQTVVIMCSVSVDDSTGIEPAQPDGAMAQSGWLDSERFSFTVLVKANTAPRTGLLGDAYTFPAINEDHGPFYSRFGI